MVAQMTGGSFVTITAALARNPIRGITAAVPMITKGGLETITQHLAMEYAKDAIRVNAVAPGVVYSPRTVRKSAGPIGLASMRTRTCPGPGSGSGTSRTCKISAGSPNRSNTTAFMAAHLHPQLLTIIIG